MSKYRAWINLAYNFGKHVVLRMPVRPFSHDLETFTGQVVPEGYIPLDADERAVLPDMMRCVHCGLCALTCPAIADAPTSAWNEAWTFVGGLSRSLDHADLVAADLSPCTRCAECDAACPTGVPITRLATLVTGVATRGANLAAAIAIACVLLSFSAVDAQRPRVRDVGVVIGVFPTGAANAITDVAGVRVGHTTLHRGDSIHTGITAVLPPGDDWFHDRVPAAIIVGNGFGKLIGSTQANELGELETPILLTCTLCVWRAADAMVSWLLDRPNMQTVRSINPVIGETNDGGLNDIRSRPIVPADVVHALESAAAGPVEEGSVGAGAGTSAFGYKGGIGTSSRVLPANAGGYTVGVLVQTNFGGVLTINGAPVGRELRAQRVGMNSNTFDLTATYGTQDGSCMIVIATDAPLDHRMLQRLANRALAGMARTGSSFSNGSGDYVIAFATADSVRRKDARTPRTVVDLPNDNASPLFQAVIEATEEAIINSLFRATDVVGRRAVSRALPLDETLRVLRQYGTIK
ncbi:MAG: P1 family peptidase [Longimicrobiales bacterium]